MKRLIAGLVLLGLLAVPVLGENAAKTATLIIDPWITVSINSLDPLIIAAGDESSHGTPSSGVNDGILGVTLTDDWVNFIGYAAGGGASVGIYTNTECTVEIHVTDNKLVGASTARVLKAAGLLVGMPDSELSPLVKSGHLGDSAESGVSTWTIQPGNEGPWLRVEVKRSIDWNDDPDPADTYTGTVTVTVAATP